MIFYIIRIEILHELILYTLFIVLHIQIIYIFLFTSFLPGRITHTYADNMESVEQRCLSSLHVGEKQMSTIIHFYPSFLRFFFIVTFHGYSKILGSEQKENAKKVNCSYNKKKSGKRTDIKEKKKQNRIEFLFCVLETYLQ